MIDGHNLNIKIDVNIIVSWVDEIWENANESLIYVETNGQRRNQKEKYYAWSSIENNAVNIRESNLYEIWEEIET